LTAEFTHAVESPRSASVVVSDAPVANLKQPIGRLEIPSVNISGIVIEGDDARTLRRGIGHIPGTALPGGPGNVGLSAHRDTFFRHLGQIRTGDPLWITTLKGRYKYVVESSGIVDPDEDIVLHDIGRPTLTLVTCYPFYYVGSAPKRFVVHATLSGSDWNN
jgi:sortase A